MTGPVSSSSKIWFGEICGNRFELVLCNLCFYMSVPMDNNISCVKSSLTTNISHLSDDVLIEIFIRLPSRSVARCKCVSKRWLDVISSPSFLRPFIPHHLFLYNTFLMFLSPHELMLTFPRRFDESQSQSHNHAIPSPNHPPSLVARVNAQTQTLLSAEMLIKGNVCGSSNGLLLCSSNRYTSGHGYYVYNPMTKESTQIPPLPVTFQECIYAVGFVCDGKNHSFRVVIIPSFREKVSQFRVEVYSSETREWIQQIVNIPNGFAFASPWLRSFDYQGRLYFMGGTSIFVYDPYGQDSDALDYPPESDPENITSFGFLGSSCGCLRIADIGRNDVRIWELTTDDIWQLVHRTNLTSNLPEKFCANYFKGIGGFHPHDGDIVYLSSYADGVFVANLRTNKFEAIPGSENSDINPFQLELALLMPPMPSPE